MMKFDYICPVCDSDLRVDESQEKIRCECCNKLIEVNWDCDDGKDATTLCAADEI